MRAFRAAVVQLTSTGRIRRNLDRVGEFVLSLSETDEQSGAQVW